MSLISYIYDVYSYRKNKSPPLKLLFLIFSIAVYLDSLQYFIIKIKGRIMTIVLEYQSLLNKNWKSQTLRALWVRGGDAIHAWSLLRQELIHLLPCHVVHRYHSLPRKATHTNVQSWPCRAVLTEQSRWRNIDLWVKGQVKQHIPVRANGIPKRSERT